MTSALCGALLFFPFLPAPLSENRAQQCHSFCPSTLGHNVPQSQLEFSVLKNEPTLPAAPFSSFSKLEELGQCLAVGPDQCSNPRDCRSRTPEDLSFCLLKKNSLPEEVSSISG